MRDDRADVPARLRGSRLAGSAGLVSSALLQACSVPACLPERMSDVRRADGCSCPLKQTAAVVVFVLLVTSLVSLVLSSVLLSVEVLSSVLVSVLASSDFSSVSLRPSYPRFAGLDGLALVPGIILCGVAAARSKTKAECQCQQHIASFFIKISILSVSPADTGIRRITVRFCSQIREYFSIFGRFLPDNLDDDRIALHLLQRIRICR